MNGDGRDDIIAFTRGTSGNVYVELSTGTGFGDRQDPAELWNGDFCFGNEICDVGDFNGDGADDVVTFLRNSYGSTTWGDVYVGVSHWSLGAGGFSSEKWSSDFCFSSDTCATGYFNADGKEDVAYFTRGSQPYVWVALDCRRAVQLRERRTRPAEVDHEPADSPALTCEWPTTPSLDWGGVVSREEMGASECVR